jgi:chaperonin GroES
VLTIERSFRKRADEKAYRGGPHEGFENKKVGKEQITMSIGIKPINDYVLIQRVEAEEKTASGIVLPSQAKEQPQIAKVIAVGPGTDEVKMVVKAGEKVIFGQYGGMEIKYGGEEYKLVRQGDIYATVA